MALPKWEQTHGMQTFSQLMGKDNSIIANFALSSLSLKIYKKGKEFFNGYNSYLEHISLSLRVPKKKGYHHYARKRISLGALKMWSMKEKTKAGDFF